MDDLFNDLGENLAGLSLEPEAREKIEALMHFRSNLELLNTQTLMALMDNSCDPQPGFLEHLDSLYEVMGKDLQDLRVKLFDKKDEV